MQNNKYLGIFNILLISLLIILVNFQFNPIGSRFYAQDFIANDYVYAEKLRYLKDILVNNIFSVINFSEGLGKNYLFDVKSRHFILDPALYLSFIFDEFLAIQIKIIIFQIIGFYYFYRIIDNYNKNINFNILFSYLFIFNLTFFSHEVSLTTNIYLLIPSVCYYGSLFINKQKIKHLIIYIFIIFFILGNSDLNILFISPLIILYVLNYNFKNLIKKEYLLLIIPLIVQLGIFVFEPVLKTFNNDDYNSASFGGINLLYFYNIVRILISNFHPVSFGPIGLFFFPILLIYLFKDIESLKKIILLYFIGLSFYFIPLIFEILNLKSPALIRYHIFVLGMFTYLILINSFYKINTKLDKNILVKFSKIILIFICIFLIIFFAYIKQQGFILAIVVALMFLSVELKKKYIVSIFYLIPLHTLIYSYLFFGFNGGFPGNDIREINTKIKNEINKISKCLKDDVKDNSVMFIVSKGTFEDYPGRNDFIMSFIESSSKISGRTYFHWRHNDNKNTSKIYNQLGAQGTMNTNYFPVSYNDWSKNAINVNKKILNNFFATNFKINDNNFFFQKKCENVLDLDKSKIYKDFDGLNYEDNIYLYKLYNSSKDISIKYKFSKTIIYLKNNEKKLIFVPVNYSKYLTLENLNKNSYEIKKAENGINIFLNSDISNNQIILTSRSINLLLPYFICIIFNIFFIFIIRKNKKNFLSN